MMDFLVWAGVVAVLVVVIIAILHYYIYEGF